MWGRSVLAVTATASVIALTASASSAGAGTVVINTPTSGTHLVTTFPSEQTVSVTFSHVDGTAQKNEGLCGLSWTIDVTGPGSDPTKVGAWSGTFAWTGSGNSKTCEFGNDETITKQVSIPRRGTYTVTAALVDNGHAGSDSETPTFEVTQSEEVRYDYPAAPAVANRLLKKAGVTGKERGKCVQAVADHMGPRATFNGVPKREVTRYRTEVETFLRGSCPAYTS
jgi:hypothetical protein